MTAYFKALKFGSVHNFSVCLIRRLSDFLTVIEHLQKFKTGHRQHVTHGERAWRWNQSMAHDRDALVSLFDSLWDADVQPRQWASGYDETVEVNQRALIDKVLARYSGEFTGALYLLVSYLIAQPWRACSIPWTSSEFRWCTVFRGWDTLWDRRVSATKEQQGCNATRE